jgi:hypothetical protein
VIAPIARSRARIGAQITDRVFKPSRNAGGWPFDVEPRSGTIRGLPLETTDWTAVSGSC